MPKAKAKPAKKNAAASKRSQQNPTSKKPARGKGNAKAVDRRAVFVREYLVDFNGSKAAIRAGYSAEYARSTASELLAQPAVQEMLTAAMQERAQRTGIEADMVLDRLWAIATADPRELIELHRSCCRYCWGKDHRYQRTPRELEEARGQWEQAELDRQRETEGKHEPRPFDGGGGVGWDPRRDPHPNCPECWGEGTERIVPKDSRDLSPAAKLLYAGVKTTQHGLEIKMNDQTGMLVNVGKHLGLFRERVEVTGKDGGPVQHTVASILDEIEGSDTGVGPATSRKG